MQEDYFEFILAEVARFKAEGKPSSVRIWRSALRTFRLATGLKKLPFGKLDRRLLVIYKEWLIRKELSDNTIKSYLGALQTAYNRMTAGTERHIYGLFKGLAPGAVTTHKRAVSQRTMGRLMQTDPDTLPENLRTPFAWFLILFYLRGIPFVDLAHLRKSDLREGIITYRRHKTGRELAVEVPKEALEIIRRYTSRNTGTPYLFPILQGKETTLEAAWEDYQRALRHFNLNLEKISVLLRTEVRLSSYTPRHTWATIAYHLGVPVGVISKGMGHSCIRVTEAYLRPFADKEIDKTNRQIIKQLKRAFEIKSATLTF